MTTLTRRSFLAGIPVAAAAGVLALTAPKTLARVPATYTDETGTKLGPGWTLADVQAHDAATPWHQRILSETPQGRRWLYWIGELPAPVLEALADAMDAEERLQDEQGLSREQAYAAGWPAFRDACLTIRREQPEIAAWYRANYSAWLEREPYRGWDRG